MTDKYYEHDTPAAEWAERSTKHALDELFNATYAYRSSKEFYNLMQFVKSFRFYSPYNALLIHIQKPGAVYVAPPHRWDREYGRKVKPNASPIVILQPMGPVMFVFDVGDTEEGPDARPLPDRVVKPFAVRGGRISNELWLTEDNATRDGIRIHGHKTGSQRAGSIQCVDGRHLLPLVYEYGKDNDGNIRRYQVPVRYELLISQEQEPESRYATLVHELAKKLPAPAFVRCHREYIVNLNRVRSLTPRSSRGYDFRLERSSL